MIAVLLSAVAAALVVLFLGRFERERALRRWKFVLSGRAESAAATLQARLAEDTEIAAHTYDLALRRRAALSYDDAVRLLLIAAGIIEQAMDYRHQRLSALSIYARMAEAIVPAPPIRSSRFKLSEVRSLTLIARWLHELLTTYGERFRFRLTVIGLGLRLVARAVRGSGSRATVLPAHIEPYKTFGDSLSDLKTLDEEQVEALRLLMVSASATDRQDLPPELRHEDDPR